MDKTIYANVLLKEGKIMFWMTGYMKCVRVKDFTKCFYYAQKKMVEEIKTGLYKVESKEVNSYEDAKEYYRQFEVHPDSVGLRPYCHGYKTLSYM